MACKHGYRGFECPEKDCSVGARAIKKAEEIKRTQYYKNYYQAHRKELSERARLRAKRIRDEAGYVRPCKFCGKPIDLKEGVISFRKKYFCSKECLKVEAALDPTPGVK